MEKKIDYRKTSKVCSSAWVKYHKSDEIADKSAVSFVAGWNAAIEYVKDELEKLKDLK